MHLWFQKCTAKSFFFCMKFFLCFCFGTSVFFTVIAFVGFILFLFFFFLNSLDSSFSQGMIFNFPLLLGQVLYSKKEIYSF